MLFIFYFIYDMQKNAAMFDLKVNNAIYKIERI